MKILATILAIVLIAALNGCNPTEPTGPNGDVRLSSVSKSSQKAEERINYYPLNVGNRWSFERTLTFDGEVVLTGQIEREMIGEEQYYGRLYITEEQRFSETMDGQTWEGVNWFHFRQDPAGLYEADLPPLMIEGGDNVTLELLSGGGEVHMSSSGIPDDHVFAFVGSSCGDATRRAAIERSLVLHQRIRQAVCAGRFGRRHGGVMDGEIMRLGYPLRRGRCWTIREEPLFTSTVEGLEVVDMPDGRRPAWRVRIDNSSLGPDDFVYIWVNRQGMVGFHAQIITDVVDETGVLIGRVESEDREFLVDIELVGRHPTEQSLWRPADQ